MDIIHLLSLFFMAVFPIMLSLSDWYYNKLAASILAVKTKDQRITELEEVAKLKETKQDEKD